MSCDGQCSIILNNPEYYDKPIYSCKSEARKWFKPLIQIILEKLPKWNYGMNINITISLNFFILLVVGMNYNELLEKQMDKCH